MDTIAWIKKTVGNRWWLVIGLSLVQSVLAVSSIVFALLMRRTVDSAVAGYRTAFISAAVGLAVLILAQMLLRALNYFMEEEARASIENCFRQSVFCGIMNKEYRFAAAFHTGEVMNRLTSDASVVADGVVVLVPGLISMGFRVLGALLVLYRIEPWIAILFFVGGCLVTGLSLGPRRWLKKHHRRVQESDGRVRSFMQECVESLLIIRAFGCEEKMARTADEKMDGHRQARRRRGIVSNLCGTGMNLFMQCGYLLGFLWGGYAILQGRISYGTLTAVLQLIGQVQTPFAGIGSLLVKYSAMSASAERLMELEAAEKKSPVHQTAEQLYIHMEAVRFSHVYFSYEEGVPVLEDESFSVRKGEVVALTGNSGIGKSTIMKLLLAAYKPQRGGVALELDSGSVPVSNLPAGVFAYVPQGNHLMGGTIWEAVGFAEKSEEVDREKAVRSCKTACAHEFIMELPMQYDTMLGEKGAGLSEGQMQRLAVARAIYSDCPILLLDEATSALDAGTEERLLTSLKTLPDRTVILITHRREVWNLCDRMIERKDQKKG